MMTTIQPLRICLRTLGIALTIMLASSVIGMPLAQAQTLDTLVSFSDHADGGLPAVGMIRDAKGNLYGTTYAGGIPNCSFGCGVVFELNNDGNEAALYAFTGTNGDGDGPDASLVLDAEGNLYGTTPFGGAFGEGTVFKVGEGGKETVLYSFGANSGDGKFPYSSLVRDAKGNLYGTSLYGGADCNNGGGPACGTIFKIDKAGKETVLYSFTGVNGDGSFPLSGLVQDASGNFYGTTWGGGDAGFGTVYKLSKEGKETVLYSFTGQGDGAFPYYGVLAIDARGNLYGTTARGGSNVCGGGCGVVFRVSKTGKEEVLHTFTSTNGDGANPYAGVIRDKDGNLYGTTFGGGDFLSGTVFELSKTGAETILYTFEGPDGPDGSQPHCSLVRDAKGNLYGTTQTGGEFDFGTLFKLTP